MLIDAMRHLGMDVHLLNGGIQTPDTPKGDHVVQLPAMRALDEQFAVLVDADDKEIDTHWKVNRCRILLEQFRRLKPDIVIIESFPFGRRQLRFELIPWLSGLINPCRIPYPSNPLGLNHPDFDTSVSPTLGA